MREVWIQPQHAPVLLKVEKLLRKPNAHPLIHALKGVSAAMSTGPVTTQTLLPDLQSGSLASSHRYTFSLIEGLEPVIQAGLVSRHLIRFARQASSGAMNASHYSAKLRDPIQIAAE